MPDPIIINGKKFITSKQGAALTGYARDYIGQLVRMGKVEGKVVEKTLFVSQDSLLAHLELKNGNTKVVENSFKTAIAENTAKVNFPKTTLVNETVVLFPKLNKVVSKPVIIKTDKIVSKFKNKSSVPAVVAVIAPYADAIGKISSYALKHAIGVVAVLTVLTTSYASIKSPELFLKNISEVFSNDSKVVEENTASLFAPVRTFAMNVNKNVNDFFGLGTSGTTIVQLPPKVFVATSTIVREVVRDIGTTTIIRYGSTAAPVIVNNTQDINALVTEVNNLKQYQKEQLEGIFDSVARGRRTTTITTTSSSDLSGTTTLTNLTVENTSTSTIPNLNVSSSFTLGGDSITDFVGSGLELSNGVLTATAGAGFSTTSSDFHFNTRLAATTTLNNLTNLNNIVFNNATTTSLTVGSDYITDLTGSGLSIINGALTVSGATGFSTTSADYWETQQVARWATTSDSYAFDTRLAATTTLNNLNILSGLASIGSTTGTTTINGVAVIGGNTLLQADVRISNQNTPTTGAIYFGNTTDNLLTFDGSNYMFNGSGALFTSASSIISQQNNSSLGLGAKYNASLGAVYFGATNSANPDAVISNNVGTEIMRVTNLGQVQGEYFTAATTTATSTFPNLSLTNLLFGSDYINDVTGSGLSIIEGALTVDSSLLWATTSDSFAFDTRLAATSTLNNLTTLRGLTDLITTNATTTTFALGDDYITDFTGSGLSIENGALTVSGGNFSTTSADYYLAATTTLNNLTKIGTQTTFAFDHATGTSLYLTSLNCTLNSNGGKITTDSSGQLVCANDQTGSGGGGGSDVNWTFFNNSGISVGTTSNQVVIGASATSSSQKLEVIGGLYVNGNVGIGTTSPYARLSVVGTGVFTNIIATSTTADSVFPRLTSTFSTTTNATTTNFFANTASTSNLYTSILSVGTTSQQAAINIQVAGGENALFLGRSGTANSLAVAFGSGRTNFKSPSGFFNFSNAFSVNQVKQGLITMGNYDDVTYAPRCFGGAQDTGIFGPVFIGGGFPECLAATSIDFYASNNASTTVGSLALRILGNGNVGVGVALPTEKLVVSGTTTALLFTATSTTATSTFPLLSTNALSLNGTYVTSLWATTSDTFAFDTLLAATTTLNNITNLNRVTLNAATTSSLAVTGMLSSLLKTNSDGSVVSAIAGTDYVTSAVTAIGPANQTQTGATVIIASSTSTANGFTAGVTIVGSGNTLTLTPTLSGVLTVGGGGTGISSPSAGGILVGNYAGDGWQQIATSSLGLLTTDITEGSNLYWTNNRFDVRLSATTTLSNLATLTGLVSVGSTSATTTFLGNVNVIGQTAMNGATIETNTGLSVLGAVDSGNSTYAVRGNAGGSNTTFGALGYDNTTACTGICNVAGVYGETTDGKAVVGSASGATGVAGYFSSATGNAVETYSTDGYGLSVSSTNSRGLSVSGNTYSIYATGGQNYFENNIGIGTTSPYAKLSVVGQTVAEYFTATSTTATSTFPLLSTNALSLNGTYVTSLWATTSDTFAFDTLLAATTTLNNLYNLGGLATIGSTTGTTTVLGGLTVNGYVGIGVTVPTEALDITGTLRLSNEMNIVGEGSVSDAGVYFNSDENTGLFAPGADTFAITTGGVERMRFDSIGNIGIGTTSPYAKLSVDGDVVALTYTATSTTATSTFPLLSTNALSLNGTYVTSLWATTSDTFAFDTLLAATTTLNTLATLEGLSNIGSTTGTTIVNGKLGVATSSPWAKLSVTQTGTEPAFSVEDATNDSTPFVIDASGNVAIGTSTPSAKLEIAGGTSGDRVRFITVGGASNRTLDFDRTIATGAWSIQSYVSNSSGTRMPILLNPNGGGIAIATTSTTLPATLAVGGSIYSADGIYAGGGVYSPGEIQASRLIATTTRTQYISNTNVTTLYTYGDSITQGSNASSSSQYYVSILARTLKYTLVNQGIAGSLLEEDAQIDSIYDQPVSTTTVATILTGYNNHRYYGTNATRLDTYKQALPVALAYLAIPDVNKKYAYDFSTTGTWAATSTYATTTGRFSRTAGSTASTVLYGNTIYVAGTRGAANDTGTMTITVDGVDRGTYSCAGTLASSNDSRVYAPFMMRVGNLSNGPHTVKVTSNTTGYCEINWAAGNANVAADGAPAVYVGGALRMTEADYVTHGVGGSIASNRLYNEVIEGVTKTLASDGLNVIKVDVEEAYDAETMVSYDRVHPNAAGHNMLAQAFLNKMSGTSFGNDKSFARFFSGYVPKLTIGAGTSTTFTFDGETGRFGIGSSTPIATLSLTGTTGTDPLLIASSTGSHMLTVVQSGNIGVGSSTPFGRFSVDTSNLLSGVPSFVVGSSTEADLIILQNGNVGLGTTTPYAKLAIDTSDTTSSANAAFMVGSSTKTDFMIGGASGNISMGTTTNNRAKVTITNLGNQPSLFLDGGLGGSDMFRFVRSDVNGGSGNYGLALKIQLSNPSFLFRSGMSAVSEGTSVNGFTHISSTNSFLMSTTSSVSGVFSGYEPMYMTNSNANIGFAGTTTPFGSVSINGVFQSVGEPTFVIGSSTKTDLIVTQGGSIGVGTTSPWRTFSTNGTVAMNGLTTAAGTPSSICMNTATKEITVNAATSCVVSDRDQKQQIEDLTVSGLDAIRAIKPVTFAYNDIPGRSRIGFIAQDLQAVDNRLGDAFDAQGIARSIDIPAILSITVKAVKELDVKTELHASTTESRFLEVIGTKPSSADNFLINGDLSFKNKFGIKTESVDSPTKYLTIHSSDGSNIITFAENGNIGIGLGSSTPAYKLQVQGDIAATAFVNISTMESKTGIKYLTDEKKEDILTALNKMKIAQYRYKSEDQSNPLRLGLIAEEAPSEVLSVGGKGIDIYKLTTFTLAAVQAQQKKIESFDTRLTALEAKVASSTATTTDSMIASVIAGIKNLFVDELTVGTKEKATGITLFDDETGAPFCIKISGGTMKSIAGVCGTTTEPKEEVKEDPKPTIPTPTQSATSSASTTPSVKETPKESVASSTPSTGGSTSPKTEEPKVEETKPAETTPAPEAPKVEETKSAEVTPAPETPKEEAPKVEEKKEEAPKTEAPKEESKPKEEAPKPSETASAPSVDSTN